MPALEPFRALRYDPAKVDPSTVVAPPYDVVGPAERAALASSSPYNSIWVELPQPTGDEDRYGTAAKLFRTWQEEGVLVRDASPTLYRYRMTYTGRSGDRRHTTGVVGALGVETPGEGDVLPHEQTLPKAKSDRLDLLRATKVNTSPIWGLSLAKGLTELLEIDGPPVFSATSEGVTHELWVLPPEQVAQVSALVATAPVVIADGHHRWETALNYSAETGSKDHAGAGAAMAFVVELVEEELEVGPIHRLISGIEPGGLLEALGGAFELEPIASGRVEVNEALVDQAVSASAPIFVDASGAWLMRALPATEKAASEDLDSARLAVALKDHPEAKVRFANSAAEVDAALGAGDATAAVLLRPVTVSQIADVAHARRRMPPKTTFFRPKPRTGMLFRPLES